jgi:hypothetical protein
MSGVGLTICGVTALAFMMSMYALERRNRAVEAIWPLIALRRHAAAVRESWQPG